MKKLFWVWMVGGALLLLCIGFIAGAYISWRYVLVEHMRHQVWMIGPGHDDYILFGKYGSKEDIPWLLYGLEHQTDTEECTYDHCIEALRRLSGANPGRTYADWTNWWVKEMHEPVPDWHPSFRLVRWDQPIKSGATNRNQVIRFETEPTP
jgi:hypothetical protein